MKKKETARSKIETIIMSTNAKDKTAIVVCVTLSLRFYTDGNLLIFYACVRPHLHICYDQLILKIYHLIEINIIKRPSIITAII
jgi:hypothetical protein